MLLYRNQLGIAFSSRGPRSVRPSSRGPSVECVHAPYARIWTHEASNLIYAFSAVCDYTRPSRNDGPWSTKRSTVRTIRNTELHPVVRKDYPHSNKCSLRVDAKKPNQKNLITCTFLVHLVSIKTGIYLSFAIIIVFKHIDEINLYLTDKQTGRQETVFCIVTTYV